MNKLNPLQKRLHVTRSRPSWLKDQIKMRMVRPIGFSVDREVDNTQEFEMKIRAKLHGLNNPRASKSNIS